MVKNTEKTSIVILKKRVGMKTHSGMARKRKKSCKK
jgi:hypothetical protein